MIYCDRILDPAIGLAEMDANMWNASYRDDRITHAVALDPGFVWGLQQSDMAGIDIPTTIVGFGDQDTRMLATDFDASGLSEIYPGAQYIRIPQAIHFTAMPLCKFAGPLILAATFDDPVCTDPDGTDRAVIHQQLIDMVSQELGLE